jgi:hypothetical protein
MGKSVYNICGRHLGAPLTQVSALFIYILQNFRRYKTLISAELWTHGFVKNGNFRVLTPYSGDHPFSHPLSVLSFASEAHGFVSRSSVHPPKRSHREEPAQSTERANPLTRKGVVCHLPY